MKTIIENHHEAANHLEQAAKHHLEAAKHLIEGDHEMAHYSTTLAHGHIAHACYAQNKILKQYA